MLCNLRPHHIHIPLTKIGLSLRGKYSDNSIRNMSKHIVFLDYNQVCLFISYLIKILHCLV